MKRSFLSIAAPSLLKQHRTILSGCQPIRTKKSDFGDRLSPLDPAISYRLFSEYGIPYSKLDRWHDPVRPAPQFDRPGLCADSGGDHRSYAAAGAAHPAERTGGKARRIAPAGFPRAASAAPAGPRRRKRPPRL